jgi:hypothetical protein
MNHTATSEKKGKKEKKVGGTAPSTQDRSMFVATKPSHNGDKSLGHLSSPNARLSAAWKRSMSMIRRFPQ